MAQNPLTAVLSAPATVPLYLRRFSIAVDYLTDQPEEDHEALEDAVSDFETALYQGFFAWTHLPQSRSARLSVEWTDGGCVLQGETAGMHHNGLVALLRLIVNLHHTPAQEHANIVAALGEDADDLPTPVVFSETVKSVRVEGLEGLDDRMSGRTNFERYLADDEIGVIAAQAFPDLAATGDGERIVLAVAGELDEDDFDVVEDAFLRLFDVGCFVGLDQIDELPGDPEFFLRPADVNTQVVIDSYEGDIYGLVELLNVMSGGRLAIFLDLDASVE